MLSEGLQINEPQASKVENFEIFSSLKLRAVKDTVSGNILGAVITAIIRP